jgi:hypothetical protein
MLTTLPPSCAVVMKSGNLNFLEPLGHYRPVTGLLFICAMCVTWMSVSLTDSTLRVWTWTHLDQMWYCRFSVRVDRQVWFCCLLINVIRTSVYIKFQFGLIIYQILLAVYKWSDAPLSVIIFPQISFRLFQYAECWTKCKQEYYSPHNQFCITLILYYPALN